MCAIAIATHIAESRDKEENNYEVYYLQKSKFSICILLCLWIEMYYGLYRARPWGNVIQERI